jgi:hypothetical protein
VPEPSARLKRRREDERVFHDVLENVAAERGSNAVGRSRIAVEVAPAMTRAISKVSSFGGEIVPT